MATIYMALGAVRLPSLLISTLLGLRMRCSASKVHLAAVADGASSTPASPGNLHQALPKILVGKMPHAVHFSNGQGA